MTGLEVLTVLAEGGDDGTAAILLAPPVAVVVVFIAVYQGIYRYYRNTDKRFHFEEKTAVEAENLQSFDKRTESRKRLSSKYMDGSNESDHLQRVRRVRLGS